SGDGWLDGFLIRGGLRARDGTLLRRAVGSARKHMSSGRKILIIDDDEALRHSLAEQLQLHEEFFAAEAGNGTEALEATKDQYFDAILLDVGLPDMDGRELCRVMRRNGVRAPILMLTGADGEA